MGLQTDYDINIELIKEYRHGNLQAKEKLINLNIRLVNSIASKFCGRGTDFEDLIQIGLIGLLKAIDGFDEATGNHFSTYAFPLITGEIKRHLRDDGQIKISRIIKRNARVISHEKEIFINEFSREPKISELAERCGLSEDDVTEAINASAPLISLQDKLSHDSDTTLEHLTCQEDIFGSITDILALKQALDELSDFEKKLIRLRFFKNLTQSSTARILGTTQVSISRSEKKIIDKLRQKIL